MSEQYGRGPAMIAVDEQPGAEWPPRRSGGTELSSTRVGSVPSDLWCLELMLVIAIVALPMMLLNFAYVVWWTCCR